jgi:hypothetical protein
MSLSKAFAGKTRETINKSTPADKVFDILISMSTGISPTGLMIEISKLKTGSSCQILGSLFVGSAMNIRDVIKEVVLASDANPPDAFKINNDINFAMYALSGHIIMALPDHLLTPRALGGKESYMRSIGNNKNLTIPNIVIKIEGKEKRSEVLNKWAGVLKGFDATVYAEMLAEKFPHLVVSQRSFITRMFVSTVVMPLKVIKAPFSFVYFMVAFALKAMRTFMFYGAILAVLIAVASFATPDLASAVVSESMATIASAASYSVTTLPSAAVFYPMEAAAKAYTFSSTVLPAMFYAMSAVYDGKFGLTDAIKEVVDMAAPEEGLFNYTASAVPEIKEEVFLKFDELKDMVKTSRTYVEAIKLIPDNAMEAMQTAIRWAMRASAEDVEAATEDFAKDDEEKPTEKTSDPSEDSATEETSDPSKDTATEMTSDPSKDSETEKASDPSKDSATEKTPDPSKDSATEKTSDPSKDSATAKTSDPSKDSAAEKTSDPSKDSATEKTSDPSKDSATEKTSDPSKDSATEKTSDPSKDSEPEGPAMEHAPATKKSGKRIDQVGELAEKKRAEAAKSKAGATASA